MPSSTTSSSSKQYNDQHKGSSLLDNDENQRLFDALDTNLTCMAAGVAYFRVLEKRQWKFVRLGVCAVVKDCKNDNYGVTFFSLLFEKKWWNVVSKEFKIKIDSLNTKIWKIKTNTQSYSLEFLNSADAEQMNACLKKYWSKTGDQQKQPAKPIIQPEPPKKKPYNFFVRTKSTKKRATFRKKTRQIIKEEIGHPTEFKHVEHHGWESSTSADHNSNIDSLVKTDQPESPTPSKPTRVAPEPPPSKNKPKSPVLARPISTESQNRSNKSQSVFYANNDHPASSTPATRTDSYIPSSKNGINVKKSRDSILLPPTYTKVPIRLFKSKSFDSPVDTEKIVDYVKLSDESKDDSLNEQLATEQTNQDNNDSLHFDEKTAEMFQQVIDTMSQNERLFAMKMFEKKIQETSEPELNDQKSEEKGDPVDQAPQMLIEKSDPVDQTPQMTSNQPNLEIQAPQMLIEKSDPVNQAPQMASDQPNLEIQAPQMTTDKPNLEIQAPQIASDQPNPTITISKPRPTPAPRFKSPAA